MKEPLAKLFVLDVSGFIFRAYFALPPMTNAKGESTNALFGFIRSVFKLFKDFSATHVVAVFDGPDNKKQRRALYEGYKANRTREVEDLPQQIERAKLFCNLMGIPQVEIEGVEADDAMGSVALWAKDLGIEVYLCTSDKDLCQLVGPGIFVLNPWKENLIMDASKVEEAFGVFPEQIIDYLAIVGDASDNIPGLPGFGPKTAVQLLKQFGTLDEILARYDQVPGKKKQETLQQEADIARLSKQLATIQTSIDFPKDDTFFALGKPSITKLKEFYHEMGFHSLLKELEAIQETIPEEKTSYYLVDDETTLKQLIETLSKHEEIAFDIAGSHIRPMLAMPVGFGFSIQSGTAYYVPANGSLGAEIVLKNLKPFFENPKISFYGHNVKYDLHVLANVGIHIANLSFDTILASYLLNSGSRRHSLDQLALHYFGKVKTSIKALIGTGKKEITLDQAPIEKVSDFCCEDVDYTLRIKKILAEELRNRDLDKLLFEIELPLTRDLYKMERAGMALDLDTLAAFSKENKLELLAREEEVFALAGVKFNLNSPKQLSEVLFKKLGIQPLKKTATGLSTNADVLEMLAKEYPIAEKILAYRTLEKLRSTYIETLPEEVNPLTGRIHPTFSQVIAATGRLACQDPNLQNIPVRTPQGRRIREAFRPQKKGWSYLAADYSQIELRLLAHLSEDPNLLKAFREGEDIHASTASLVFGVPLERVSSLQRHQAKAINFGILYGQQAYGLSQELGIDIRVAADFIQAYFARYPSVQAFIEGCIEMARKTGKSVTMIGREREIPEIFSTNAIIRSAGERLAVNTPLQGSAADLIKLAMLEMNAALAQKNLQSFMVLQVHDELIFEAPDSELEELAPLVKTIMEGVFHLKVPLQVDIMIGKNWAEC